MFVRSTRGNPYHHPAGSPKGGQFAPKGKGNRVDYDDAHYEERTAIRRRKHAERLVDLCRDRGIAISEEDIEPLCLMEVSDLSEYSTAVYLEPEISKSVLTTAGTLLGFEHRLKTPSSVLEKIKRKGRPVCKFYDILRYTAILPPERYSSGVTDTLSQLKGKGYKVVKISNSWNNPNRAYNGVNVKLISPEGQNFELQFHTQESFDMKENELHRLYEKQRRLKPSDPKFNAIERQMIAISRKVKKPKGVDLL